MSETFADIMKEAGYVPEEEVGNVETGQASAEQQEVQEEVQEGVQDSSQQEAVQEPGIKEQEPDAVSERKEDSKPEINFLNEFNARFKKNFEKEEEVNKFFEDYDKLNNELSTRKQKDSYYQELESNIKDIIEQRDPVKEFGSEEEWHRSIIERSLGNGRNKYVANKIAYGELDKADNLSIAAYRIMYDAPDVSEGDAKRAILRKLGVDFRGYEEENDSPFDISDPKLTVDQKTDLSILASEAKREFSKLKESIKLPERSDVLKGIEQKAQERQQNIEQNKQGWEDAISEIKKTPPKIEFFNDKKEVDFTYDVDDKFLNEAVHLIKQDALNRGIDPTKENVRGQIELLKMYHAYRNLEPIAKAYAREKADEVKRSIEKEINNEHPINRSEAPFTGDKSEQDKIDDQFRALVENY